MLELKTGGLILQVIICVGTVASTIGSDSGRGQLPLGQLQLQPSVFVPGYQDSQVPSSRILLDSAIVEAGRPARIEIAQKFRQKRIESGLPTPPGSSTMERIPHFPSQRDLSYFSPATHAFGLSAEQQTCLDLKELYHYIGDRIDGQV